MNDVEMAVYVELNESPRQYYVLHNIIQNRLDLDYYDIRDAIENLVDRKVVTKTASGWVVLWHNNSMYYGANPCKEVYDLDYGIGGSPF